MKIGWLSLHVKRLPFREYLRKPLFPPVDGADGDYAVSVRIEFVVLLLALLAATAYFA